jgi:hypothetical protein
MLVKIAIGHKPSLLPRSNTLKDRNALIAIAIAVANHHQK